MKRVMIVGGAGSGKSTLARWLGAQTGLPVYYMDHIQWMPDWQPRPRAQRREMALEVEALESWIFEGGFSETYNNRAVRADTLIWLDLPVGLRLWRVTRRLFQYWGKRRPDMAEGCVEKLHGESIKFYLWIWNTRVSHRLRLQRLLADHGPGLRVVHLRSPAEVSDFQKRIEGP
ncbi:MAG: AAA family ATPase [Sulfitobacter sp.]